MSERLFFALWPDEGVRRALVAVRQAEGLSAGRPTHEADLHLTLVFLGPLSEPVRGCVEHAANGVRAAPFRLRLDALGHWPGPRILWCAPTSVPDALQGLVRRLADGLGDCGIAPERRPFRPHVTLARAVRTRGQNGRRMIGPIEWPVSELVLAGGAGGGAPRYRVHRRWPLES